MNIVPGINKWSSLIVRGTLHFFLVGMVWLGIHGLLAYVTCGRRSGDNLFSFMVGGALAFRRRHYTRVWLKKLDGGVGGRESGEERENGKRVLGRNKEFVFGLQRDSLLNTQVINAGMKGGDRSTIRKGMKLMKRRLCFKITTKLGNLKRQHCSRQIYIYICMCKVGTIVQKARKRKWKDRKGKKVFYSHMNRRNASYVQRAKCWWLFWKPKWKGEAQ